jgi:FixJ family two-component response regulator
MQIKIPILCAGRHRNCNLGGEPKGSGLRTVHLVDDDGSYRTAMKRRLEMAGFGVLAYSTAEGFLEHADGGQAFGCLVLDIEMPGMCGLQLQDCLRARGSVLPILFVSGCVDEDVARKALEAGAAGFLAKPIRSDQLIGAINAAMAQHEMVRPQTSTPRRFADGLLARAAASILEARVLRDQNRRWRERVSLDVTHRSAQATFSAKSLAFHRK